MQSLEAVSHGYNARQRALTARAVSAARRLWSGVSPEDIARSWSPQIRRMVSVAVASQRSAAAGSTEYVSAMLRAQGATPAPEASVSASAFAQSAADGRPLGSLFYVPIMNARQVTDSGGSTSLAYQMAGQQLLMMVATEVADAGRLGMSAAMLADRRVRGYYRNPGPAACARCAILAGLWSDTAEGASFERHPKCQCTAVAAADRGAAAKVTGSPRAYFNSLPSSRQDYVFGKANAEAIRAGADPAQVINARRGMSGPGFNWTTTEGTTSRGLYGGYIRNADGSLTKRSGADVARSGGRLRAADPRLTPAAIMRLSSSREEAVAMLRKYGYLV